MHLKYTILYVENVTRSIKLYEQASGITKKACLFLASNDQVARTGSSLAMSNP